MRSRFSRVTASVLTAGMLTAIPWGMATAEEVPPGGPNTADLNVSIDPVDGALTMEVLTPQVELTQQPYGGPPVPFPVRSFKGDLIVRVTDGRGAHQIPDSDNWWSLTAKSSALSLEQGFNGVIEPKVVGATPVKLDGDLANMDSLVRPIQSSTVGGKGLEESGTIGLGPSLGGGRSSRFNVQPELVVRNDVRPGAYVGTITLSLFQ